MVCLMDVSRAYFDAQVGDDEPIYVKLPPEMNPEPRTCALLCRHMHGTRRAGDGWQSEYCGKLREMGFEQGSSSACVSSYAECAIAVSVHGDDFKCSEPRRQLMLLEQQLRGRYKLTVGARLGPVEEDDHEGVVLNRIVRCTSWRLECEAGPRQA